jgi:glycosyltransferase involved in cell wall biosynthesis
MKILLVITKAVVGGAQMSVLNLARELKMRGHEIIVGFGDGDFLPAELEKENIPYVRFRNLKRTHNPLAGLFFAWEMKNFLQKKSPLPSKDSPSFSRRGVGVVLGDGSPPLLFKEGSGGGSLTPPLFQGGVRGGFDAVHFNSSNALPGALGVKLADKKIKTVFTFRGMSMLDEHYQINKILKFIYRLFFKIFLTFVDAPVFVSQENLDKFGRGQLTAKGVLIYNGLNPAKLNFFNKDESQKFLAEKSGQKYAYFSDKYFIGSIGRLDYQKNYEFLINIFPEILKIKPEAIAVIIGGGPEEEKYRALIKKNNLGEKIFLLGSIANASRYIKAFDLFILPSRYEGLSITLIEALFAGLPVLTSDVGGNKETVGASEELYGLDKQTDFLAGFAAIQKSEVLNKILENNKKQAEKFILAKTADGYEKIYKTTE